MNNLNEGNEISIKLGGGLSYSCVVVQFLHGKITQETEKAIEITTTIKNKEYILWLPKKAIVTKAKYYSELANWFKPNRFQRWVFDNCETNGISVA